VTVRKIVFKGNGKKSSDVIKKVVIRDLNTIFENANRKSLPFGDQKMLEYLEK
jgi:hypothetical protein